jgi:hypothetical protein
MNVVEEYLNPQAVRRSTKKVYEACLSGDGLFQIDESKLDATAAFVVEVIKENYPDLNIPYHSRWGHFKAGNEERLKKFFREIKDFDKLEQARICFDLVIPSVLLDAGAGPDWKYNEVGTDFNAGRSEGLGVASFYMFKAGCFSKSETSKLRSDALQLQELSSEQVAEHFQVSEKNPLVGLEGRTELVRSLGKAVAQESKYFIGGRPGGLVDYFQQNFGQKIPAKDILQTILLSMGSIWPGRINVEGINLGDAWKHTKIEDYVVFHKLSQWLSYSLFEPLEQAGFEITNPDDLTGLAEYRNGGLFYDLGLIQLKDKSLEERKHLPSSDVIIEWRALTVQLLDKVAPLVREKLGLKEEDFPLAKILEGGTWWAGRKIASQKRSDKSPPLKLDSDGTVF